MNLPLKQRTSAATPALTVRTLPPSLLNQVAERSSWAGLLAAGSLLVFALLGTQLQSELALALSRPGSRLNLLVMLFVSMGFVLVQKTDRLSKTQRVDVGSVYQVVISFSISIMETAMPWHGNEPVRGVSGLALWLVLSGFLLMNAPLKAAIAGMLSVACWPLAYWINLHWYGFEPLPWSRLIAWNLPNVLAGCWMFFINRRVVAMEMKQLQAEELGSYQLAEPIAQGGMGEVWRAKHRMLARQAAIKVIRPDVLQASFGSEEALVLKRFRREAEVTARLQSPHTVALYDFGQTKDGAFYYVMELLNGINLQVLVDRFGPVHPGRIVSILLGVCDSLEEAHLAGLIHRDIKPLNIFLCTLGLAHDFVKVLDFGLVATRSRSNDTLATKQGLVTGTPGYVAPEAAMGSPSLDGRTDLYSLGCVAYFMVTGHQVFEESSPLAQSIAHVQTSPVPPSQRTELTVPPALEELIMKLLEKNPDDRISSAHELARRLREATGIPEFGPAAAADWWNINLPTQESIIRLQAEMEASGSSSPGGFADSNIAVSLGG